MSDLLHLADFAPWMNQTFHIRFNPEVTLPAELIEAREAKNYSPADRIPFSLIFRTGQKTEYYGQTICTLLHPEKGEIELFLVPIGLDTEGMRYQAVFA